ncbi:hypothetical protein NT01EI_1011 [Edwardsiella ictaluri 93-146]|uniref:Uncharacterized protein n=1 Tax=Edwardsiella ictaluri (strain 93-146) TaxID=634503 RepID=C5BBJ2_EDWI9|nr:hypothetical protein NT01EI_1011 [Edwardsiella ictaluri 93-146]
MISLPVRPHRPAAIAVQEGAVSPARHGPDALIGRSPPCIL